MKKCKLVWIQNNNFGYGPTRYGYRCSNCKQFTSMRKYDYPNYCPKCGAKNKEN